MLDFNPIGSGKGDYLWALDASETWEGAKLDEIRPRNA